MMSRKKMDSKTFAKHKMKKRRLLTLYRIIRYGLENFMRNSWLSVAATAVMTITLLIVFIVASSKFILTDTVSDLGEKVDMSIYLKTDTTDEVGGELRAKVEELPSVRSAEYISAEDARDQTAQENKNDTAFLEAIKEATNMYPATLRVVVEDINDTSELENFVQNDEQVKEYLNKDYAPSFAGERRDTIKSIGRVVGFIQQVGIGIGVVFVIISSLIIFNTISMAIFNRREEIQMMNLIGANKAFIRGPFLVESVIYGIIAAILASGIGFWGLYKATGVLASYEVSVQPTIDLFSRYVIVVVLAVVAIGSLIGIISSTLATRKYLKS